MEWAIYINDEIIKEFRDQQLLYSDWHIGWKLLFGMICFLPLLSRDEMFSPNIIKGNLRRRCDIETLFISLSQTEFISKINPIPPNKNYWSLITPNVATFVIFVQRDNNIFVKITKI